MNGKTSLRALLLLLLLWSRGDAAVVLNEIFYHAPNEFDALQWIELHNPDREPVDLTGWQITGDVEFQFPAGSVLAPGGFVVLCKDAQVFAEFYDAKTGGEFTNKLRRGGGNVTVVDAQGKVIERVRYDDRAPWPVAADGLSASLERITPGVPGDQAANWASAPLPEDRIRPAGTPGRVNANYAANFPPLITHVEIRPDQLTAGQAARVSARVEDGDGVARVELCYRLVAPGAVGDEKSLPMSSRDGRQFFGELPGLDEGQLVRVRIRAVDRRESERYFPAPHDLRPAISLYVGTGGTAANIPLAQVITTDPDDLAEMNRLRRQALQTAAGPGAGPVGGPQQFQLLQVIASQFDLSSAWFECTINQTLDPAKFQELKSAFRTLNVERERLIRQAVNSENPAAQVRELEGQSRKFDEALREKLKEVLSVDNLAAYDAWQEKQKARDPRDPAVFASRMINIEGTWFGVNERADFTPAQVAKLREPLRAALVARNDATGKIVRREIDSFEKFQALVGGIEKDLYAQLEKHMSLRQRRALTEFRSNQPSPIRPRVLDPKPRPPRGRSALIVVDPQTGKPSVFDFVHISERSAGYRIRFHKDQPWNGMTSAALIFEYNDRFVLAEPLAFELYRRVGTPACETDFVRLSVNGHPLGYHLVIEQVNTGFLRRRQLDPGGDLYKILWYRPGLESQHEKQNHPDHTHEALTKLVAQLQATKGEQQWAVIEQNFKVDQVVKYFAVNTVLSHWDGFFNNYFTFHDRAASGTWTMFPWDQDKTWGFHDNMRESVFVNMPLTFGMAGDQPPGGGGLNFGSWWRPGGFFSQPLLANPEFRKRYLQCVRQILEEVYNEKEFFPVIDALSDRLRPEIPIRAQVVGEDPAAALERLDKNVAALKEHLVKRRQFLLEQKELVDLPR